MKKLLFLLLLISLCSLVKGQALVPGVQKTYTMGGRTVLAWTPADTTVPLHLLISFVGNGANDSAACVNQGPAKRIRVTTSGLHRDSFFVVTIIRASGENGGAMALSAIDAVLDAIFGSRTFISTTDSTRNSMTGLSQGNREVFRYLSDWGPEVISYATKHRHKFSREVLLSNGADEDAKDYRDNAQDYRPSGTRVWYGGTAEDPGPTGSFYPNDIWAFMVARNPAPRTLIDTVVGGGHTSTTWDSAWNMNAPTPVKNTWRWLLQYSVSNLSPSANAGNTQTLALGTTSTTVSGSSSVDPDGSIVSYAWTQIFGASTTILTPNSVSTTINGLTTGAYQYRLVVTDNNGATGADTLSIIVTAPRSPITTNKSYVAQYNGSSRVVPLQNLFDNDTTTTVCPLGFATAGVDLPTEGYYWFDHRYMNMVLRVWNGPTAGATPLEFTLYNEDRTDSVFVTKVLTINSYNYIDSNTTKGARFPVAFIKFVQRACYPNLGELRVEGTVHSAAPQRFNTSTTVTPTTFDRYVGAVLNGDEPDTLLNSVGAIDVFNNWWYTDSNLIYTPGAPRSLVNNVFGNPTSAVNALRARGLWIENRYFQAPRARYSPIPAVGNYGGYGDNKKYTYPILYADSTNHESYRAEAEHASMHTLAFGRVSGPYILGTFTLYGGGSVPTGQNVVDVMHFDNEHDFTNPERYQGPKAQFAKMHAIYDGAMSTMGPGIGVKNVDPSMLVYVGPQVGPDTLALKAFALESYFRRGVNNLPIDGFAMNQYFVYGGAQAFFVPSDNGISPGQMRWKQLAEALVSTRDRFMSGKRISIKEFGWDKNQNTSYSALAHGPLNAETVQANWIIQAFHIGRAAKIDDMRQYRSRDEGPLANNGDFVTSGQFVAQTGERYAANYWMSTMMVLCRLYDTKYPTQILDGDSTSLSHVKYDTIAGVTDTVTSVLWMSTHDGSDTTITLTAPGNVVWAEKVTMLKGDKDGVHTPLTPSGANIPVGTVGETPVYVRYILGTPPPTVEKPLIRSHRFN